MTDEIDEDLLDDIDVEEHLENAIDGDDVRDPINADEPEVELDAEHDELDDIPDKNEIEEEFEEILDRGDEQSVDDMDYALDAFEGKGGKAEIDEEGDEQ